MYDRRKLIDDLVASGVPEVPASGAGSTGSPMLALLYIIIPILAVAFLISREDSSAPAEPAPAASASEPAAGGGVTLTAANVAFDQDTLSLPAGKPGTVEFVNDDTLDHNLAFYKSESDGQSLKNPLWTGEHVAGGASTTYTTDPLDKGTYHFQCDIHPSMAGTLNVE
jgi:plastocyanin